MGQERTLLLPSDMTLGNNQSTVLSQCLDQLQATLE